MSALHPLARPVVFLPESLYPCPPTEDSLTPSFWSSAAKGREHSLLPAAGDTLRRAIRVRKRVVPHKKRDATLSWVFLGTAVTSGAASMYFKNTADERYESYLRASSPKEMNRYYDEACRFDRYAAIAYGGFQVSFVAWVFFFLRSR
ncbi:MAG: hypothetical protein ONB30_01690 [candidate division KSB1 bacterium]|nr:hypothetical protein [candidate division KSB1 bacterium]